jgi:hypothetical protein
LYVAGFGVRADGQIEMFDDMLAAEDLPIEPLSFNPEFQFTLRSSEEPHR